LTQITMTLPSRLMILHFAQIFFTDGRTFIAETSDVLCPRQPERRAYFLR
jgi:hypothetical protein